jgi:hypothetical protein
MDNTTKEAIEARIKGLTTLIFRLQPQCGIATSGNAKSSDARAYHYVATLLTRGVEDGGAGRNVIAVTGAHTVTGAAVTAVSSESGPPSSLPLDKDLSHAHMAVTQNQSRKYDGFSKEKVEPNPVSLADICKGLYVFPLLYILVNSQQEPGK